MVFLLPFMIYPAALVLSGLARLALWISRRTSGAEGAAAGERRG